MGNHDDGSTVSIQVGEDFHDLIAVLEIQVAGGLVSDYDLGIVGQGPGYGHPLPLSAGDVWGG